MEVPVRILVDADACPVKATIESVAKEYQLPILMVMDTSHQLESDYCEILQVDKGSDCADFALINRTTPGDIVVTQDYGVATMALAKHAHAIHPSGKIYTNDNIDFLMNVRHLSSVSRRHGTRTKGPKKRTKADDAKFEASFRSLCLSCIAKEP